MKIEEFRESVCGKSGTGKRNQNRTPTFGWIHNCFFVVSELFTFGMLSYFYSDMKTADQKALSSYLYGTTYKNLISWLRCCTDMRNICAHYGRLYYRIFSAIPAGFPLPESVKRRLWCHVLVVHMLYPNAEKWNGEVLPALQSLFDEYQEDIDLYHIAFPDDWATQLIR